MFDYNYNSLCLGFMWEELYQLLKHECNNFKQRRQSGLKTGGHGLKTRGVVGSKSLTDGGT